MFLTQGDDLLAELVALRVPFVFSHVWGRERIAQRVSSSHGPHSFRFLCVKTGDPSASFSSVKSANREGASIRT